MRRPWAFGVVMLVMLVMSCASATERPAEKVEVEPAPEPVAEEPAVEPAAPRDECEARTERYLDLRAQQNHCERDDDCAEQYPGLCPHGPYYTHVAADHAAIDAAVTSVHEVCPLAKCEMPRPLGIGHCEAGRCVQGRSAPKDGPHESCWDTRVTYLQPGRPVIGSTSEHLQGITPLHAVGVATAGTLRLTAQLGCDGCELMVSEHNSGMSKLVKGTPFTPEPDDPSEVKPLPSRAPPPLAETLHLEYPVTPGIYYIATVGGSPSTVQYEVQLRDRQGRLALVDRRGVAHLRLCEG